MRFSKYLMIVCLLALTGSAANVQAQIVSDSDFLWIEPATLNIANNSIDVNFSMAIMVDNATTLGAISVPLAFPGHPSLKIDTTVITLGNVGVSYGPAGLDANWTLRTSLVLNDENKILIGFVSFAAFPPTSDTLCYVHFDLDGSGIDGLVNVDSTFVPPANHVSMTDVLAFEFTPEWSGAAITIGSPQPEISLTPTALTYNAVVGAGNPLPQNVSINNSGVGTLQWTATPSAPWLSATPSTGLGNEVISVSVNTAGLAAGPHTGYVIVADPAASNSPESLTVTLILTQPNLAASPPSLVYVAEAGGANPAPKSFTLTATSAAAIAWTASATTAWVNFLPTSGTTPNTITVTPNIAGLTAGTYYDTITVVSPDAGNSPFPMPITLLLTQPPLIDLSPNSLSFLAIEGGTDPDPDTVSLTNTGAGTLDFSASTSAAWLSVLPVSGVAPADLEISTSVTGLTPAVYTGYVIVASPSAANSPESVTVTLEVQANPPILDVSPQLASFTATEGDAVGTPASVDIDVANIGAGVLNFTITGVNAGWLQVTPSMGTAPATLTVSVDPTGLTMADYADTFQVVAAGAVGSPADVVVTLDVAAGPPTISLSPTTFNFAAIEGGTNPTDQSLAISNIGGSTPLNWTTTHTQSWLTVSPEAGTAPSNVALQVNSTGLGEGTYYDTVVVTGTGATNTPQTAAVTLVVGPPPPQLAVSPDSLLYSATVGDPNPAAKSISITNTGGGALNWTATAAQAWLSASPDNGTAPATADVSVNIAGLTPGTYNGAVVVASGDAANSPVTVPVTLVLSDLPPVLSVSPLSLTFDAQQDAPNPPDQSFSITNTGGGILSWAVSTAAPWIVSLDPPDDVGDGEVTVSVDIGGLSAGTHIDSVLVDAGPISGSPTYVIVTLNLAPPPPPEIVLDPTTFNFTALFGGGNPTGQALNITNGGGRTLEWTTTNSSGWLVLSETSGTAPSTVTLDIDVSGLGVGTYFDTVWVSSDSAINSPQLAFVQLDVVENPPQIVLTPTTFYFEIVAGDPDPPSQTLQVDNSGAGSLNWTATKRSAWLTLLPSSGLAPTSVDVSVSAAGLIPGTYRDTIVVSSGDALNSPQEAIVTFQIKSVDKPSIELQPDSLYFIVAQGEISDPQCMYIFIDGNGGRLVWRANTDADWIDLSRDSCNISYPLCVTVDAFGFEPGMYCDSVSISGDATNSPQFLHICMDVRSGGDEPILVVRDTLYNFTATVGDSTLSAPQPFTVTNSGSGTLNWTASSMQAWVVISPTSGTAPSTGSFQIDPFGLSVGSYTGTVEFDAPGALGSPQFVTIYLTVEQGGVEPPILAVSPDGWEVYAPVRTGTESIPVYITNTGGGSLTYTLGTDLEPWLAVSKTSGSAPDDLTATITFDGLIVGDYYDTIVVSSPEASNSPDIIPVFVRIQGEIVDGDSVRLADVSAAPGEQIVMPIYFDNSVPLFGVSVPLTYAGESIVADSVSFVGTRVEAVDLLEASIDSVDQVVRIGVVPLSDPIPVGSGLLANLHLTVLPGAPNQVVAIDTTTPSDPPISLAFIDTSTTEFVPGFRAGSVTVSGAEPPVLAVEPDSLHYEATAGGANPAPQLLMVLNTGGSSLTFTTSEGTPWLSVNPTSGDQDDTVFCTVDITGLAENTYAGNITFDSPEASNDPVVVPVTLQVLPGVEPPVIVLTPDHLNFTMPVGGPLPLQDTIVVSNSGGGALNWTATHSAAWFEIAPGSGTDGDPVEVSVTDAGLAAGTYVDTITFTDAAAGNSPQIAVVELQVQRAGSPDTVFVESVTASPGDTVSVAVRVKNSFDVQSITLPFTYEGVGVTLIPGAALATPRSSIFTIFSDFVDTIAQTGLYGFVGFGGAMAPGDGDVLIMKFAIAADAPDQVITIDTTMLPPSNHLTLVDPLANEFTPDFVGGTITVGGPSPAANLIWVTDTAGEPGDEVTVEVFAENGAAIDGLFLPLGLTSQDVSILRAEFTGTRSDAGTPNYTLHDAQHITLDIDWSSLAPGTGPVARLVLSLSASASPQMVYVDTAGEYGFVLAGGSQTVVVPQFSRGTVELDLAVSNGDDPYLPHRFALAQNYPNPFNPSTSLSYTLQEGARTTLTVYNILGQPVVTLVDRYQSAGEHTVRWDGRDRFSRPVPSGVYLYRLESGTYTDQMRMTLMK